jgi:hypothetical protein
VTTLTGEHLPEAGDLVRVRGQQWVVSSLHRSSQPVDELAPRELPGRTMVSLTSVSDDDLGDELTVVWEVEPGREVLPGTASTAGGPRRRRRAKTLQDRASACQAPPPETRRQIGPCLPSR